MDAEFGYLLIMLSSGSALQIIRQQLSGVQAFRDLAPRYNPRSQQPRSWAQLQELMHFEVGQEPAGVTNRLLVFERLVGDCESSRGGVLGAQVKCPVLLEMFLLERRTHLLLTCGSRPDDAIMRQTDWEATQKRDARGSQAIQRYWGQHQQKSTACMETEAKKEQTRHGEEGQRQRQGKAQMSSKEQPEVRGLLWSLRKVETQAARLSPEEHCR